MNLLETKVLSHTTLAIWLELQKNSSALEDQIVDRINYIVRKICEVFNDKLDWWDFPGDGNRGEGGRMIDAINGDKVSFVAEAENALSSHEVIFKDNSKWDLNSDFPKRWLFENFEEELIEGKERFKIFEKNRLQNKRELAASNKIKNKMLVAQAKAKLSKEELAALKKEI